MNLFQDLRALVIAELAAMAEAGVIPAGLDTAAVSGTATVAAAVSTVGATDTLPSSVPDPAFPPLLAFLALLLSLATLPLGNRLSRPWSFFFLISSYKKNINKKNHPF